MPAAPDSPVLLSKKQEIWDRNGTVIQTSE
jgi:hypothetical protein